ncbi:MAG: UbiX family flavin prenyltransferase [Deltaproteobacteria bacterium]|nr:UbiX family flavin prenyltransferase [Deltaproteobacteria bacterium]
MTESLSTCDRSQRNETLKRHLIVAVTGASGAPYARELLRVLPREELQVHVVASRSGRMVYEMEVGVSLEEDLPSAVILYREDDFTAPFASGSFPALGMVVVPCTMGTLAALAGGISLNLIHRAADVCLKERRRLILVPRETPLNQIHLENMLRLSRAGAVILPAMPGFYNRPGSVEEIVQFVVARILDHLEIPQDLVAPWNYLP